ncbi:uncharacterized protein N7511_003079 [Penicillium nucicola]|uniref:uncharacterized protein n=1 Tax=Penicillium nucicola TaxID=1850975 RepID=UPI00254566FD|nr:uncharacterized protein N7511_003079 [Penicillium nucicola]KAJ5771028.1 hypothetical protein N7511_003079 [Penicillium nucicola]
MDLLTVLPGFQTKPYQHLLPALERTKITTVDLLTIEFLEIAKRAHVPPADIRRLCDRVVEALHADIGFVESEPIIEDSDGDEDEDEELNASIHPTGLALGPATSRTTSQWNTISTLDPVMDDLLGGGIPTGYMVEITGESGSGKTQFLMSLCLAVQLPKPYGLRRRALYISTEHPLSTPRLSQLIECHPILSSLSAEEAPSLEDILSINAMDLEAQDHILNYQLPVAIQRYNIGLVIIDSITSNYRAEHSSTDAIALATRTNELAKLGHMLRNLAVDQDVAIVVANQVSDRFDMPDVPDDPDTDDESASQEQMPSQTAEDMEGSDPTTELSKSQPPMSEPAMPQPQMAQPSMSQPVNMEYESTQQAPSDSQDPPSSSAMTSSQFYGDHDENTFQQTHCDTDLTFKQATSVHLQERFFTGWGDDFSPHASLKNPAMGIFWSSQIACRIALKKEESRFGVPAHDVLYPTFTAETAEKTETSSELPDEKPITASEFMRSSQEQPDTSKDVEPAAIPAPEFKERKRKTPDAQPGSPDATARNPDPHSQDQDLEYLPDRVTRRTMKLVFAPWAGPTEHEPEDLLPSTPPGRSAEPQTDEVDFEIWAGGLRSVSFE